MGTLNKARNGSNGRQWRSDQDALNDLAEAVQRRLSPCAAASLSAVCTAALLLLVLLHPGVRFHAQEKAQAIFAGQQQAPAQQDAGLQQSSDKQGFCRLDYTVKTWDGKDVRVCDPSVCVGRDKLKVLDAAGSPRRWSAFHESAYMKMFNAGKLAGWLKPRQLSFVKALTAKQHELGIYGAVGEIGVHHGKFLVPIVGNALQGEPAVAIDLFENQGANVDTSGRGNKGHLLRNLEASGIPENSIKLLGGNSMLLTASNFSLQGYPAFRMLSVDGGHTLEITLHDLMLASCVIQDGGLVILDDFPNPAWLGVAEALMHWVHAQDRLVPFMHGANKLWFTTPSHVQEYKALLASNPKVFPCVKDHVSKRTIAGVQFCWTGFN